MYDRGKLRAPKSSKGGATTLRGLTGNDRVAVQWALGQGYRIPTKPDGCLWTILIVLGFGAAIVPGLAVLGYIILKQRDYEKELRQIINKWVDAGKPGITPDPGSAET